MYVFSLLYISERHHSMVWANTLLYTSIKQSSMCGHTTVNIKYDVQLTCMLFSILLCFFVEISRRIIQSTEVSTALSSRTRLSCQTPVSRLVIVQGSRTSFTILGCQKWDRRMRIIAIWTTLSGSLDGASARGLSLVLTSLCVPDRSATTGFLQRMNNNLNVMCCVGLQPTGCWHGHTYCSLYIRDLMITWRPSIKNFCSW